MEGSEFRWLVLADAHNQVTAEEAEWLRSGEICERWRETLVSLISYYKSQREHLDRQLADDEQRLLPQGGAATYRTCELVHAQNISKIVQQMGQIQQRLGEANRVCKTLHPPPPAPPPNAPLAAARPKPMSRVQELKKELSEAHVALSEAQQRIHSLERKLKPKETHALLMEQTAASNKRWGNLWRNTAEELAHACRLAVQREEARGLDGDAALLTFLRGALRTVDQVPQYPDDMHQQVVLSGEIQLQESEGAA